MNSDLMTIKEVMEYFKVTRQSVNNWTNQGILTKVNVGGRTYYRREEVVKVAK